MAEKKTSIIKSSKLSSKKLTAIKGSVKKYS
jgi:hypothetical protein